MLISELPNTPDYPLRALAELRAKKDDDVLARVIDSFIWGQTREKGDFWEAVNQGQHPPIPAESIEDLRRAGMMPEPGKNIPTPTLVGEPIITIGRITTDTAPPPPVFFCHCNENLGLSFCQSQCEPCAVDEQAARKHNNALTNGTFAPPPITLSDYTAMESEHEAITSPGHYKVGEGLEVVDIIRAVLTPEQFRGYCLGNLIKYRMRAGKKTMSPIEDLGKAHVYETWLAEMEGGEG